MELDVMQDRDAVAQAVTEIIAEQAMIDRADISHDNTLSELGLDSLGLVECIFGIEERFGITVPFNANTPDQPEFDISSVGAIISEVEKLVARQAA